MHSVKSIHIRSFSGPYFPAFGPEVTPYLDIFYAVVGLQFVSLHAEQFKSHNSTNLWLNQYASCDSYQPAHYYYFFLVWAPTPPPLAKMPWSKPAHYFFFSCVGTNVPPPSGDNAVGKPAHYFKSANESK